MFAMIVEWKSVIGYEDLYEVSSDGRVRSVRHKKLKECKQQIDHKGYIRVCLYKNGKTKNARVHRLVLEAFVGKSDLQVDHIDGNKKNNNLSNLEYVTPKENIMRYLQNNSRKVNERQRAIAKETMKNAGIPVVNGSDGIVENIEDAKFISNEIGYPVILKASAGGGGKGIRIAYSEEELIKSYNLVKQEAKNAFNNDDIYIEKFIEKQRHIEIQVIADKFANVCHLGEKDCTIQRNNQKINQNAENINKIAITETYTVASKVKEIFKELIRKPKFVFNKLYTVSKCNKQEVVTAFTGLLELSRRSKVTTTQEDLFGDIVVEKKKRVS